MSMTQGDEAVVRQRGPLADYFLATRGPWYGFLFALPILLAYELLELVFRPPWVNGADAIITRLLQFFGPWQRSQMLLVLIIVCGIIAWRVDAVQRRDGDTRLRASYFTWMLIESVIYAFFLGSVVNWLMQLVLPGGFPLAASWPALQTGGIEGMGPVGRLTMALGAGIYEELFFRVLTMGGLMLLFRSLLRMDALVSWIVSVLISSLVFSLFHYVGAGGESFEVISFLFRFFAGAVLATLYALRGFGVAVWTHALYDVLVLFVVPLLGG